MNEKQKWQILDYSNNLLCTRKWCGTFEMENAIVKREFEKFIDYEFGNTWVLVSSYYMNSKIVDVGHCAAIELAPIALLTISKYALTVH